MHRALLPASGSLQAAGAIEKVAVKFPVEIQKVFTHVMKFMNVALFGEPELDYRPR